VPAFARMLAASATALPANPDTGIAPVNRVAVDDGAAQVRPAGREDLRAVEKSARRRFSALVDERQSVSRLADLRGPIRVRPVSVQAGREVPCPIPDGVVVPQNLCFNDDTYQVAPLLGDQAVAVQHSARGDLTQLVGEREVLALLSDRSRLLTQIPSTRDRRRRRDGPSPSWRVNRLHVMLAQEARDVDPVFLTSKHVR